MSICTPALFVSLFPYCACLVISAYSFSHLFPGPIVSAPAMRTAPSFINDNTVKTAIAEEGNILMSVAHKHLVRIDWVSSEDGSHMLTLGVGSKVTRSAGSGLFCKQTCGN